MKKTLLLLCFCPVLTWGAPWEAATPTGNPIIDTQMDLAPIPFAQNWEMTQSSLPNNRYALSLTLKRFHTGGAGEALAIFKTRAESLKKLFGFSHYSIEEYAEGIVSHTIGARRVAYGVISLQKESKDEKGFSPNSTEKILWPKAPPPQKTRSKNATSKPKITLSPNQGAKVETHPIPRVTEMDGVQLCLTPCANILEK